MNKLTRKQLQLLLYLEQGNYIEVCTSIGRALGQITYSTDEPKGATKAVLDSLYAWGLVRATESNFYGVRFARFSLTNIGRNIVRFGDGGSA